MSEAIDALRKAFAQNSAVRLNIRGQYPYEVGIGTQVTIGEQKASPGSGGLVQVVVQSDPVDATLWQSLQVTDTSDPNLGLFYFQPDIDYPGDPTKVVR